MSYAQNGHIQSSNNVLRYPKSSAVQGMISFFKIFIVTSPPPKKGLFSQWPICRRKSCIKNGWPILKWFNIMLFSTRIKVLYWQIWMIWDDLCVELVGFTWVLGIWATRKESAAVRRMLFEHIRYAWGQCQKHTSNVNTLQHKMTCVNHCQWPQFIYSSFVVVNGLPMSICNGL